MRDLVGASGGGACAAPDARASSSNPLGRLADAVLGDHKGKHPAINNVGVVPPGEFAEQFLSEQRLRGNLIAADDAEAFSVLPGGPAMGGVGAGAGPSLGPGGADVAEFMRFQRAWGGEQAGRLTTAEPPSASVVVHHPALRAALHSAVASVEPAPAGVPPPPPAQDLHLTPVEKTVIRNRSAIMARHLHAQGGEAEMHARLGRALGPLHISASPAEMTEGPRQFAMGAAAGIGPEAAADNARAGWVHDFARQQRAAAEAKGAAGWAEDFARMRLDASGGTAARWAREHAAAQSPSTAERWAGELREAADDGAVRAGQWADEYNRQLPGGEWAAEFRQEQEAAARDARAGGVTEVQAETAAQSAKLVETLAANPDPKFQNSQFLQFMSRMSRGEIVVEGNGVKDVTRAPSSASAGGGWADEFAAQRSNGGSAGWAEEFAAAGGAAAEWANQFGASQMTRHDAASTVGGQWAGELAASSSGGAGSTVDAGAGRGKDPVQSWADEFAEIPEDWAREFEEMQRGNPEWAMENVWDHVSGEQAALRAAERSHYQFTDPNPYLGNKDALEIGRDLFRRGVLSEAALALEAAVRADAQLCEGWRLLGTVHAENDDDRRAIAAMTKANEADPANLEVLLSLAVSHTNELDQEEAIGHMRAWLRNQPRFAALEAEYAASAPTGGGAPNSPAAVLSLFTRAVAAAPRDADVHAVLGVLAHLCRDYDAAIAAFNTALEINPQDYSLWNKLGATQANSARSADAMSAYQRALDLKPNYVRAWCNMGIGFANQGRYEESVAYYVRALSLNPQAESAWSYLRISLGCSGRIELMEAVDNRDLETLQKHFPL